MPKGKPVKKNPEKTDVEMITVSVPKHLPKGLERVFDSTGGGWRITSMQGLKAFGELALKKAL